MGLAVTLRMQVHFIRHVVNNIYEIVGEVELGEGREDILLEAVM